MSLISKWELVQRGVQQEYVKETVTANIQVTALNQNRERLVAVGASANIALLFAQFAGRECYGFDFSVQNGFGGSAEFTVDQMSTNSSISNVTLTENLIGNFNFGGSLLIPKPNPLLLFNFYASIINNGSVALAIGPLPTVLEVSAMLYYK